MVKAWRMASKALTKEIRGLVSSKTKAVRTRLTEAHNIERMVMGGAGVVAAGGAAALDHYTDGIPLGGSVRLPWSVPVGAAAVALGAVLGKGAIAAGLVGAGFGAVQGVAYAATTKTLEGMSDDDDTEA